MDRKMRLILASGFSCCLIAFFCHYKERTTFRCQTCWAKKDVYQWHFGIWSGYSVPISSKSGKIGDTRFFQDFLSLNHTHDWEFAQGSPYLYFGTSRAGCAIGRGRYVSQICALYESLPQFRIFIRTQVEKGNVSESKVISMASYPRGGEPPERMREVDALINSFWDQLPSGNILNSE